MKSLGSQSRPTFRRKPESRIVDLSEIIAQQNQKQKPQSNQPFTPIAAAE
jgi:hypothetical protein